ncbi:MAG: hypothetical protein ACLSHO_02925 [Dysosmobacter sp.]
MIRCAARQDYDAVLRQRDPDAAVCGGIRPLPTSSSPSPSPGRRRAGAPGRRADCGTTLRRFCSRPELAAGEPEVLGPAPAPVVKVNNRFRYRCTLVGKNDKVHAGNAGMAA